MVVTMVTTVIRKEALTLITTAMMLMLVIIMVINKCMSSCKMPVTFVSFNQTSIFSTQYSKTPLNTIP